MSNHTTGLIVDADDLNAAKVGIQTHTKLSGEAGSIAWVAIGNVTVQTSSMTPNEFACALKRLADRMYAASLDWEVEQSAADHLAAVESARDDHELLEDVER